METTQIREGDIFSALDHGWCYHGLFVAVDSGDGLILQDTYWEGLETRYIYDHGRKVSLPDSGDVHYNYRGNRSDYEKCTEREWDCIALEDRLFVPDGGRAKQYWRKKGSQPDLKLTLELLQFEVSDLENQLDSCNRKLTEKRAELISHLASMEAHQ